MIRGFLGIDAGTQGLSVIFTDESMKLIETGEGGYDMASGLPEGCYEQHPDDWISALTAAMNDLRARMASRNLAFEVLAIGISGQMHGEVLADAKGNCLGPARLWCDSRNEAEAEELTARFGVKMPKRITSARWLWTQRNRSELAAQARRITTPGGWIAFRLTGKWNLGIGDAAGMFPIDQSTLDYDSRLLAAYRQLSGSDGEHDLASMLPCVCRAGEDAGALDAAGADILGLKPGIPVAPAEGDQPAALAGSLIGDAGMISMSFGTSVCANSVGDRAFQGVSRAVDHFCAPDGKPINMVWLRNGTTYMNTIVEMFGAATGLNPFIAVMPHVISAPADCGGILALPFMDDEPGVGVGRGGTATLIGLNEGNATAGNAAKAAILSTMFNLRLGSEALREQGFPSTEIILSGGLTRTPELGQVLADVFDTPVTILESGAEGSAWGAALMAKFRHLVVHGTSMDWSGFLKQHASGSPTRFAPQRDNVQQYTHVYQRYQRLLQTHPALDAAMNAGA